MRAEAHIGFGHVEMGGWGRQVTHKQRRAQGKEQSWRSPEHKKKVVIREISTILRLVSGFKPGTQGRAKFALS